MAFGRSQDDLEAAFRYICEINGDGAEKDEFTAVELLTAMRRLGYLELTEGQCHIVAAPSSQPASYTPTYPPTQRVSARRIRNLLL